jgi:hypothetical protein
MAARSDEEIEEEINTSLVDSIEILSVAARLDDEYIGACHREKVYQEYIELFCYQDSFTPVTPKTLPILRKVDKATMRDPSIPIPPGEVFFVTVLSQIFPMTLFTQGAEKFGDIDKAYMRPVSITHNILSAAICNPRFGSLDMMDESTSKGSSYWPRGEESLPKVLVMMETLVKDYYSKEATADDLHYAEGEDKVLMSQTYNPDNVIGFRIWYFIIDPDIDVNVCVLKNLEQRMADMGQSPLPVFWPMRYDNASHNIKQRFANAISSYPLAAKRHNEQVAREINSINRTKDRWLKAHGKKEMFTKLIPETMHEIIEEPLGFHAEIVTWYTGAKKLTRSDLDYFTRDNHTIDAKSEMWKKFMDFERIFGYANKFPLEWIKIIDDDGTNIGTNDEQLKCYINRDTGVFTFPFPDVCFSIGSKMISIPDLFYMLKFPWNIPAQEVMLKMAEDVVQQTQAECQTLYIEEAFKQFTADARAMFSKVDREGKKTRRSLGIGSNLIHSNAVNITLPEKRDLNEHPSYSTHVQGAFEEKASVTLICHKTPFVPVIANNLRCMTRFKTIAPYLSNQQKKEYLSVMRKSGFESFMTALNSKSAPHVPVVISAHKQLTEAYQNNRPVVKPNFAMFAKYGPYNCFLIQDLIDIQAIGFSRDHYLVHEIRLGVYRSASERYTETMYNCPGGIYHILMVGPPAQGKTWIINAVCEKLCLENTVQAQTSSSQRAMNTGEDTSGGIFFHDEANPSGDKRDEGGSDMNNRNLKLILAEDRTRHLTLQMKHDKAGNVIGRESVTYDSNTRSMRVLCANNVIWRFGEDNSLWTRFLIYIIANTANFEMPKACEKMMTACSNSWTNVQCDFETQHKIQSKDRHALNVMANKMIACSALPFPCMDIFYAHLGTVFRLIVDLMPSVSREIRYWTQIISMALAVTIDYAVCIVFFSPLSPFITRNVATNTHTVHKFSYDHLKALSYYLFMPEDAAITTITRFVNQHIFPEYLYKAAFLLASYFADWEDTESYERDGRPLNARYARDEKKHPDGSVFQVINYNYLEFNQHPQTIARFLTSHLAINEDTLTIVLVRLLTLTIQAVYSEPKMHDSRRKAETRTEIINVFEDTYKDNGTGTHTYRISTFFLMNLTPQKLQQKVIDAICYNGIRPRTVAIGVQHSKCDYLLKTVNLVPGSHTLKIRTPASNHENFKTSSTDIFSSDSAFYSKYVMKLLDPEKTRKRNTSKTSSKKKSKKDSSSADETNDPNSPNTISEMDIIGQDAETLLCNKWLDANFDIADKSPYLPKNIQKKLMTFISGNTQLGEEGMMRISNYPESLVPVEQSKKMIDKSLLFDAKEYISFTDLIHTTAASNTIKQVNAAAASSSKVDEDAEAAIKEHLLEEAENRKRSRVSVEDAVEAVKHARGSSNDDLDDSCLEDYFYSDAFDSYEAQLKSQAKTAAHPFQVVTTHSTKLPEVTTKLISPKTASKLSSKPKAAEVVVSLLDDDDPWKGIQL